MDEIALLLADFEQNPKNQDIQQKVLNLARKQPNSSELIQKIIQGCVSKLSKEGTSFVSAASYDFGTGKSSEIVSKQLDSRPGPLGKLHSEHLYLAAKCIGYAKDVDKKVLDDVINHLLSEFNLEIVFPRAAIIAFSNIGKRAIPALMGYLKDREKETFSREDAALALGAIGSDSVVEELTDYIDEADYDDKAMSLYALGKTRNPKARRSIMNFLNSYPDHSKIWVAKNALGEIPL